MRAFPIRCLRPQAIRSLAIRTLMVVAIGSSMASDHEGSGHKVPYGFGHKGSGHKDPYGRGYREPYGLRP